MLAAASKSLREPAGISSGVHTVLPGCCGASQGGN